MHAFSYNGNTEVGPNYTQALECKYKCIQDRICKHASAIIHLGTENFKLNIGINTGVFWSCKPQVNP